MSQFYIGFTLVFCMHFLAATPTWAMDRAPNEVKSLKKRVTRACDRCRVRHQGCDGIVPCSRCNEARACCTMSPGKRRGKKPKPDLMQSSCLPTVAKTVCEKALLPGPRTALCFVCEKPLTDPHPHCITIDAPSPGSNYDDGSDELVDPARVEQ